jgi:hypothetical protein
VSAAARAKLAQAKARLDTLDLYPTPVRMRRVRLVSVPWLFRLPWFRRFDGYTMWDLILVRAPVDEASDDLVTHELCHVWQMQHHPLAMPLSYLYRGYRDNPNEGQAREAEQSTRRAEPFGLCDSCRHQRLVRTGRGSVFTMCLRSKAEPAFPKYPRVPVTSCPGHEPRVVGPTAE